MSVYSSGFDLREYSVVLYWTVTGAVGITVNDVIWMFDNKI